MCARWTASVLPSARARRWALWGESGCGKSTTGNCGIIRLLDPSGGEVLFEGKDISKMSPKELKPLRRDIQMIFQDPYSSLDPRMRVFDLIAEPFRANEHLSDEERADKAVCRLMDVVGLPEEYLAVSRTSFPAASASASALPARWPCARSSSSATSPSRRWTCRFRRRF